MLGLEINPYAAELARTALWIGYIQWYQANGIHYHRNPILSPMDTIRQADAILADGDTETPRETDWPAAEFIIGNPPFLGHFPFREQLGDEYVNAVYSLYGGRIPNSSDLCCYWFEKARAQIAEGKSRRNANISFMGATKVGPFEITAELLKRCCVSLTPTVNPTETSSNAG